MSHAAPSGGGGLRGWVARLEADSLRRQYSVTLSLIVAVLVVTAVTTTASAVWVSLQVTRESEEIIALQRANRAVLQDLTDADSGLRGYGITEDRKELIAYEVALSWLPQDQRRLRDLAAEYPELAGSVERQDRRIRQWIDRYAEPRAERDISGEAEERFFEEGVALFGRFRDANEAVEGEITQVTSGIRQNLQRLLAAGLGLAALIVLVAVVAVIGVARRMSQAVIDPLTDLSGVIGQLRAGDSAARAEVVGPQEIRDIAAALNVLAEENLRGRDIEVDVLARLQELDRVRTDLVSTVSHELRTPLTSIKGYLELIQDQLYDRLTPQQLTMLGAIRRNLDRLTELISNLLALSRAESTELSIELIDLRGVVAEVASDLRVTATGREISLRTVLPASPVVLAGDRSQLIRAVSNLAANAVKFSRPGGSVELRVEQDGSHGVITVADEGIGIPAADLAGLGSRFYRASNAVQAEIAGTGLGLRIVQTILDHHDGTLTVESVEGEGTTAVVRIPLRRELPTPELEQADGVDA